MKKYQEFIQPINEMDMAFSDFDISNIKPYGENTNLENLSLLEIGKQGKLAEYIAEGYTIKFGMLKALYQDAVTYKKKREYQKGLAKFAIRAVPMALAPVFFPVWLLSQILGGTRALNKVIVPTLIMDNKNYDAFLKSFIIKTMNFFEGDIRPVIGRDWYYDVFYVNDGLIKMVRKEHIYEFTFFIAEEIQKKKDNQEVPKYWLDNEFRKWLNNKFDIDLPTGKTMIKHKEKQNI